MDSVKKALTSHSGSKQVTEAAAVTCVKLCKAATYINSRLDSNNVIFSFCQAVIGDLKALLFKAEKPFSRGPSYINDDKDLLTDFFLANFRLNPHNSDTLKVCLNTQSHSLYHHVLVSSLHIIITQRRLAWWEQIGIVYSKSSELRAMFIETLNRVTQGLSQHPTLKLMPSLPNLKDKALGKGNKYSATEDEKLQKTLLLCIVRLIHADPKLMLNNQGKTPHEIQSSTLELINGLVTLVQVWPLSQSYSVSLLQKFLSSVGYLNQPLNSSWSRALEELFELTGGTLKGPHPRLVRCFRNYKNTRTLSGDTLGVPGHREAQPNLCKLIV